MNVGPSVVILPVITYLVDSILAILLLLMGIGLLKKVPKTRKYLLNWTILKFVTTLATVTGQIILANAVLQLQPSTSGSNANELARIGVYLVVTSLIYPLFLLISLNSKAVIESLERSEKQKLFPA